MADQDLANQVQSLLQQVADLQIQLQALKQEKSQAKVTNPVIGPFSLTPARATQDVIDLSTPAGIKLYKTITTPLQTKFDGSPTKLLSFLDDVEQRASLYGWNDELIFISDQDPVNPQKRNLLLQHRMLSIANVKAHAASYIGTQTRLAQDASMMYEFLRNSLSEGARARLATDASKYTINGTKDGPCYLKTLLSTFYVETRATNYNLRQKMQHLPFTIEYMEYNITAFNHHVQELIRDLASGGETSTDLLVYLFEAYLKVKDKSFLRFIEHKKEDYDDGSKEITVDALLDLALVKYNQLKQSGTWLSKTKIHDHEQVFILLSQLQQETQSSSNSDL
jgi:hypothetical protein